MNLSVKHRLVILISGSGSNLQAIIDAIAAGDLNASIELVISNKADVKGLSRAQKANIKTLTLDHSPYPSREAFDLDLIKSIDKARPDTVVLAGFMRILTAEFVSHYRGKLLNIHPSLLPKYQGLNTHQRAIDAGDRKHGCSIHFVSEELDGGPVIAQAEVSIAGNDDANSLSEKVQQQEYQLYPLVLEWRAQERLHWTSEGAELDGNAISESGIQLGHLPAN